MDCHNLRYFLKLNVKVAQLCLTLCNSVDYRVHGILQARILEWVDLSFSRGSSKPRNQTGVSCIAGKFFTNWAIREALSKAKCVLIPQRLCLVLKSTRWGPNSFHHFFLASLLSLCAQLFGLWCFRVMIIKHQCMWCKNQYFQTNNLIWARSKISRSKILCILIIIFYYCKSRLFLWPYHLKAICKSI